MDSTGTREMIGYVDGTAWIATASVDEIDEIATAIRNGRPVIIRPGHSLATFWNRPRKTTSPNEIIGFVDPQCPGYDIGFVAAFTESFPDVHANGA